MHPTGRPKISVIIPTYNRDEILDQTLSQLTRQTLNVDEFEVIVSDDGSSDGTRDVADSFSGRLQMKYQFQDDLGFRAGTARNAGARLATAPVLCFIDTGALPGPDFLRGHLAEHRDGERHTAVVGYSYGYNPDFYRLKAAGDLLGTLNPEDVVARFSNDPAFFDIRHEHFVRCEFDLNSRAIPWNMFFTVNCSMRADDFWGAGGFDDSFTGWGGEDIELAFRLYRRGLTFRIARDCWVVEWPHERPHISVLLEQFKANLDRYVRRTPEPVMEIGYALIGMNIPFFSWNDEFRDLTAWSAKARDMTVTDEIAEAFRSAPAGTRTAILGCGAVLPVSLPPAIVMDFDRSLMDQALASGRHTGFNSVGLRTPLTDQSVDLVIVTSRLSGLWERWHEDVTREAQRIGKRTIVTFDAA